MSQEKNPDYSLKDLQPSQFYISQAKLSNIQAWFRKMIYQTLNLYL